MRKSATAVGLVIANAIVITSCSSSSSSPSPSAVVSADDAGAGDAAPPPATGALNVTVTPSRKLVAQGDSTSLHLKITRSGAVGPVQVALATLPAGVLTSPITIPEAASDADLPLVVAADAAQGETPTQVVAWSGDVSTSTPLSLVVTGRQGSLDPTFGTGGIVATDFGKGDASITAVTMQDDGRVLVCGMIGAGPFDGNGNHDAFAARFERDGALDTTFGDKGVLVVDAGKDEVATGIAQRTDKMIVLTYASYHLATDPPDGNVILVDPTGKVVAGGPLQAGLFSGVRAFAGGDLMFFADAPMPRPSTGSITTSSWAGAPYRTTSAMASANTSIHAPFWIAGRFFQGAQPTAKLWVAHVSWAVVDAYTWNLKSDLGNAVSFTDFTPKGSTNNTVDLSALVDQADGRVLAASGACHGGPPSADDDVFRIYRFDATGKPDPSLGGAGDVAIDFGAKACASSLQVLGTGFIAAGNVQSSSAGSDFALARHFITSGLVDRTFGVAGQTTTDFFGGDDAIAATTLDGNGGLIAVGSAKKNGHSLAALARYRATP